MIGWLFASDEKRRRNEYASYGSFIAQATAGAKSEPSLARALAATAGSRLRLAAHDEASLRERFVIAVAAMDRADLVYLRTICETLPPASARELLAATAAFRSDVGRIRQRTREQFAAVYERYGRKYGDFDPLDPYLAPYTGLTHADETRIAAVGDGARAEIDASRSFANRASSERLQAKNVEALLEAKRRRRTAFEAAVNAAFEAGMPAGADSKCSWSAKTVAELSAIADSWY